jgi:hypothetical protein
MVFLKPNVFISYQFQFNYPNQDEIQLYLQDKLTTEYHHMIDLVKRFSNRFDLNYDSLRAIAFELNRGQTFMSTMEDLNISSTNNEPIIYDIEIHHSDGTVATSSESIDLMSSHVAMGYNAGRRDYLSVRFSPLEIDIKDKSHFVALADQVDIRLSTDDDNDTYTSESGISVVKMIFKQRQVAIHKYGREIRESLL